MTFDPLKKWGYGEADIIRLHGERFSPLGETGHPKGEDKALPTTLSGLGSANGSCPRSLLNLRGWGIIRNVTFVILTLATDKQIDRQSEGKN